MASCEIFSAGDEIVALSTKAGALVCPVVRAGPGLTSNCNEGEAFIQGCALWASKMAVKICVISSNFFSEISWPSMIERLSVIS